MLYDLATDPHESNSRTGNAAYAGDLALLRGLNEKLKSCTGETCWVREHRRHKTVGVAAK